MEASPFLRGGRGRGGLGHDGRGRPLSRNKHWSATDGSRSQSQTPYNVDNDRWERGGHRGGGRGRGHPRGIPPKFGNVSLRLDNTRQQQRFSQGVAETTSDVDVDEGQEAVNGHDAPHDDQDMEHEEGHDFGHLIQEPELETQEERDKFYQELVKAREIERKKAIAEGKMDDPLVPKRLEDAITIVGTCLDMCPRFERYRRERENNLFEWEMIPGTRRVDHNRAVKMYERGAGDRILPSDLRPPHVLKRTLDYLFHDLLPRGGFSPTFNFIRDRTRAVRNDFTMQHLTCSLAMECHDRCARFHILALHMQRDDPNFSSPLEEQQMMNTLQSLKEFYQDQRGKYQSPTELEMRVYHRLIHIRDQRERHDDIPEHVQSHPVFKLTTEFRQHVQKHSAPISKTSKLVVTDEGMQIFSNLAAVLIEQGNTVMVYLVACILERLFGKDTIEDIESLRGGLTISEIIDGTSTLVHEDANFDDEAQLGQEDDGGDEILDEPEFQYDAESIGEPQTQPVAPTPVKPNSPHWLTNFHGPFSIATTSSSSTAPATGNAFAGLVSQSNVFGTTNVFGNSVFSVSPPKPAASADVTDSSQNVFGGGTFTSWPQSSATPNPSARTPSFPSSTTKPPQPTSFIPTSTNIFGVNQALVSETSHSTSTNMSTSNHVEVQPTLPPTTGSSVNGRPPASNFSFPFSLNPKAPEFTPPILSRPSMFPQPFSAPFPAAPTVNAAPAPPVSEFALPKLSKPSMFPQLFPAGNAAPAPPVSGPFTDSSFHFGTPAAATISPTTSVSTEPAAPTPPLVTTHLGPPTAPPLLRINTNTSSGSSSNASPRLPHTPKLQPVSLPSTPSLFPPNPQVVYLRSALEPRGSLFARSSREILSPLTVGTPIAGNAQPLHNFTPLSTPQSSQVFQTTSPPLTAAINGKGKAPDRSMYDNAEVIEEMKKKALAFSQKSWLVKDTFSRWLKRAMDRAAWHEACRHGDEYRQRINSESRHSSVLRSPPRSVTPLEKKGRLSMNGVEFSQPKRRTRKTISADYRPPRTDEDLAQRFKENVQEHGQRWAQGSFLQVIRKHIQTISPSTFGLPWDIWLSLNPDTDATAIWLERKFDMPDSGSWVSDSVFTIPLSPSRSPRAVGFPGFIVFECTPLGDVVDELEKKYRALDDCSRLRDVMTALPAKRHFVPSLLVINWAEEESSIASDFSSMAKQLASESIIQSYHIFSMTASTKDLDFRLQNIFSSVQLDTEGKLVQSLSSRSLFKAFEPTFTTFFNEWMENSKTSHCNWNLYRTILKASISVLDTISHLVHSLLEISTPLEPFPNLDLCKLEDSSSTYDSVLEWLSNFGSRDDARVIAMDLQSHRNIGQEFPLSVFIDLLYELIQVRIERLDRSPHPILTSDLNSALDSLKKDLQLHHFQLLQIYNFSVRRSPKRRTYSVASSEQGSPEAKRPRLISPVASSSNGDDLMTPMLNGNDLSSPTPSTISLAQSDAPTVTVSMLRALTKDLRKKYIAS